MRNILINCLTCIIILLPARYLVKGQGAGPQPGDIYKEYIKNLKIADNWRVTDPDAGNSGAQAFLPNPVLTITIDDLDGAVRAEALMDIWGGHTGTIGKKVRFNSNDWIDIPAHPSIEESPECYNSEFNYIADIPLGHLQEGENTFEGTSGGQTCYNFNWGQWGWYVMVVRIYYTSDKPHPTGSILSHTSGSDVTEKDTIIVNATGAAGIKQVDLLAHYRGYDENGDGLYTDWHRNYHTIIMDEHLGTDTEAPYTFIWNNLWVPDQEQNAVKFIARIQDNNGVWFVTEIVDSINFVRPEGISVKMYTAESVPRKFWVRAGEYKTCNINIDSLEDATNAILKHRTWNGQDGGAGSGGVPLPLSVNSWKGKVGGVSHNYKLSIVDIPLSALTEGTNKIGYRSDTEHHGIEILWPGPAILVRSNKNAEQVATPVITPEGGEYEMPVQVSISCETPGVQINYTTTGPDPNLGSRKYSSPITISDSSIVKAIATRFDFKPSEIAMQEFYPYLAPQLEEAWKGPDPNTIIVRFNKPVEESTAENTANYSLDEGTVLSAVLDTGMNHWVVLTVDGLVTGMGYSLTVSNVTDNTGTAIPANSVVPFTNKYVIKITASDANEPHVAGHTMDGNPETYWSANGTNGVWIEYDLGTTRLVTGVDIAFFLGDQRQSYFSIETSANGMNWTEVFNGESSGTGLDMEYFDVTDSEARYLRILGMGNSSTSNWNSYTEVQINWHWETQVPDQRIAGIHVYPVPASEGVFIDSPLFPSDAEIVFVNAMGQRNAAFQLEKNTMIPTGHLDPGPYLLIIKSDNRIMQQKILIIND